MSRQKKNTDDEMIYRIFTHVKQGDIIQYVWKPDGQTFTSTVASVNADRHSIRLRTPGYCLESCPWSSLSSVTIVTDDEEGTNSEAEDTREDIEALTHIGDDLFRYETASGKAATVGTAALLVCVFCICAAAERREAAAAARRNEGAGRGRSNGR